jgi:hypothetical protein
MARALPLDDRTRIVSDQPYRHGQHRATIPASNVEETMPKYLITYHGGEGMPASDEARQQVMAAFMAWVQSTGDAMIDPGAPLGRGRTVTSQGDNATPASEPTAGYTVIEADDLDTAVGLVRSHPFITRGGTLQVLEAVAP